MKIFKVGIAVFLFLTAVLIGAFFYGQHWITTNLESLINSKPDRLYDFKFEEIEFQFFQRSIAIHQALILPFGPTEGVYVEGKVLEVFLNGVSLKDLYFRKVLKIGELKFDQPEFHIHIPLENTKAEKAGNAMKSLFGDILSRGRIQNFEIINAQAIIYLGEDRIGGLSNLNILAEELKTDSLTWSNPIPFEYGRILMAADSLFYDMNNGQQLRLGKVRFDTQTENISLKNIVLTYPEDLYTTSQKMDYQIDLFDISVDSLVFSGIAANSNFYSEVDIRARKLEIFDLRLEDFRNKSLPRPKDVEKPLFQGMVSKIGFPLKLDTLLITNGTISYGESVPSSGETFTLHFKEMNGTIFNITTIPEYQTIFGKFSGNFKTLIEGKGKVDVHLSVPYEKEEFDMEVDLRDFNLPDINQILKPIMNGSIVSGKLDRLNLKIHANSKQAKVKMIFDYSDLKMEILQKDREKKNLFKSTVANLALSQSNLPGNKKYLSPDFILERNIYRGPFFMLWQSTKEGMIQIVPGAAVKEFLKSSEK
jgi:hypothetical protein